MRRLKFGKFEATIIKELNYLKLNSVKFCVERNIAKIQMIIILAV